MPGTLATDRVSKKWPVPLRSFFFFFYKFPPLKYLGLIDDCCDVQRFPKQLMEKGWTLEKAILLAMRKFTWKYHSALSGFPPGQSCGPEHEDKVAQHSQLADASNNHLSINKIKKI